MIILIVDTETTGTDPAKDSVIEVAAMLYDTRYASAIESFACLIRDTENMGEKYNGISTGLLLEAGRNKNDAWERFCYLSGSAECFLAHNASFDQRFSTNSIEDSDRFMDGWDSKKPWVCSMSDLQWPGARESKSLVSLALSLGLGVSHAHRAMSDVDTLARCLTRANEVMRFEWLRTKSDQLPEHGDFLEPMIRRGMRPKSLFYSLAPFEQKHIVKAHGFQWKEELHGKNWFRTMPAEDAAALPFRVRAVTT